MVSCARDAASVTDTVGLKYPNVTVNLNPEDVEMKKKKATRSTDGLTTLDEFLKEEGKLEEFEAVAIEEVLGLDRSPRR